MSSMEEVWKYREEVLYPQLFGEKRKGIFVLGPDDFSALGAQDIDPRWLHLGVFEFEPTPVRNSWLYVTSGGSTPWEGEPADYDPEDYSWIGSELVLEVPSQAGETWPIKLLQKLLAYNVLLAHGRFGEDKPPLDYGDRIPLGGPIRQKAASALRHVLLAQPKHYPATAQLDSGKFDFLHVVGISDTERDWAKARSSEDLVRLLEVHGHCPVTDPKRAPVA
ncbi:Suppressor of fused protein (SUFU) [Variovorax sp. PDC80]|uniref:suppressor of fused domain protein n=1 Tax=Variovorax sp. PDC80 TaxID=1882827 RepID=UPI0008EA40B3|nr:suppressor of fused domain protein [Variovorax sp. PDC80]SFN96981.1 Suppressor of fused protein (SUFU) [Variovorax sp. PDC80]